MRTQRGSCLRSTSQPSICWLRTPNPIRFRRINCIIRGMTFSSAKQATEERVIFDAFLRAHRSFAATVAWHEKPDAQFPDRIVTLRGGSQIDFELGEWLHGEQMTRGKSRERLVETIENVIGEQWENTPDNFRTVMLVPRSDLPRFEPDDMTAFHAEIWTLIEESDREWPEERSWHSPQGRRLREFAEYPTLGKYISTMVFEPMTVAGRRREKRPTGIPWIFIEPPGGSYSPDTALSALEGILRSKIERYGGLSRPVRLLVHYGKAVAYNTPWYGVHFREFRDVAVGAAQVVKSQSVYEKIYLLFALEPGLEAYEIWPNVAKCD